MSNTSVAAAAAVACPPPFLPLDNFPYVAGQQSGRFCGPSLLDPRVQCCLPCPLTDWVYPDNFTTISEVASWVGVGSVICCLILLVSLGVLPARVTSRHYLTICLIGAVFFLELAFVIPLGSKPEQCYDKITPNNLHSDLSCAFSGAFVLGGGFAAVMWVFIRSLSVHLQICWKIVPSTTFFYISQVGGWGITAAFLALSLSLSGVSYRLGSTCHINHENSTGTFWGPMVALAALSVILQLATFAYCIKVYLQVANGPRGLPATTMTGDSSTQYTSTSGSNRSAKVKRATYRRVRKVIALQWRGMTVVVIVIISAVYLATVFLLLDADVSKAGENFHLILPWAACIAEHGGDKEACLDLTRPFILREQVVLPLLYLVSIMGFWSLFFLGKWDMVGGWIELVTRPFRRRGRVGGSSSSSSLRARSQESFSTRMRGTPQHLHIVKGERGLSVANKANMTFDIELTRSVSTPLSNAVSDRYLNGKDIESAYSNQSLSQHAYESNSGSNGSHSNYNNKGSIFTQPHWSITAPERVWPGPQPSTNAGRGSFNFSRPSTAQGPQPPPPTTLAMPRAPPPSKATSNTSASSSSNLPGTIEDTNTGITTASGAAISAPLDPIHGSPAFGTERMDSLASQSDGWYMQNPPAEEDTVPLSPTLPPTPYETGGQTAISARTNNTNTISSIAMRPRLRSDSRASSLYSFSIVGRSHAPSPIPHMSTERPSQGMAWDPASSFTGSAVEGSGMQQTRKHYPSRSTSSSPALGRSANRG